MWKFIAIILIFCSSHLHAAKILAIFPVPTISHQKIFRAVTEELENRGHELTIISTDPQLSRNHVNTTEIDINFSYMLLQKAIFSMSFQDVKNELESLETWFKYEIEILEKQFEYDDVQYLLRNKDETFDLVIVENVGHSCWYAFAEYFNAPLVGISASEVNLEFHEILGNSANPIRDPDVILPQSDEMNFSERFKAWRFYLFYEFYYKQKFHALFDKLIKKYFPNGKSSSQELKESMELMLINTHPGMQYVRPMVPTAIQLGFLHIKPLQAIEDEALKSFLDQSEKSIVYVNFGANVNSTTLQEPFIQMFKTVFKSLPFDVIWRWNEAEEMTNKPDNVFATQWLPQADLLADPKIKLFITCGSQLSIEEAIDSAVPMLVIPFYGDQSVNAMKIQKLNVGLAADINSLNEKLLRQLIDEVLYGQYKENILTLQNVIHDVPMKPVDKAVWWIEYAIRHNGTKHFRYRGMNVPFYQKYMLDFAAIFIVILHIFIGIAKILIKMIALRVRDEVKKKMAKRNENPIAKKIKMKKKKQ